MSVKKTKMKTFKAKTVDELKLIAPKIIEAFGNNRIITFNAPMGAGKTTLIKAICESIGTNSIVNSPTFAIINDYETLDGKSIFHFDLYRLKNINEAIDMGCEDYLYSGNYCFIEWPEIIENLLPETHCNITISVDDNGERSISID